MRRLQPTLLAVLRKPSRGRLMEIYRTLRKHYGPRRWWPAETALEMMVGAILTQNTAWSNVEKAIAQLKRKKHLAVLPLLQIPFRRLTKEIQPAGYFNVKARRLRNLIKYLRKRYDGDSDKMSRVPMDQLRGELLAVNGVGPETADSILLYAAKKPSFVVDAYTRRVFARHRYLRGSEDYDQIKRMFSRHLRKSVVLYNDYHAQIVQVAKDYCRSSPRCEVCPLKKFL